MVTLAAPWQIWLSEQPHHRGLESLPSAHTLLIRWIPCASGRLVREKPQIYFLAVGPAWDADEGELQGGAICSRVILDMRLSSRLG